ncbi:MAG: bicyclomycin resistance protein [Burkholderiales bacterium]|jgi:ABC-type transport system substrate-binding protein|nr:bicyclomycin resistance protein [Burkholderiales bacterium]
MVKRPGRLQRWLVAGLAALTAAHAGAQQASASGQKVLRYAFPVAETGFDPAQVSDLYSRTITAGIFEGLLAFDFLARPFVMKPLTARALPEISADFTSFTFRIKPGILFADDPAFKGAPRELTAADYVYAIKRHYDPRWKSPNLYLLENARLLGLSELRKKAIDAKQAFPYDVEVEGVAALDRYTLRFRLAEPSPRFHQQVLTDSSAFGAMAREVVEFYGDKIMEHPVGTGPYRLGQWRRSSLIVLERNPRFREEFYDEQPSADDPVAMAIAKQMRGKRMPMIDRVEVAIIEEVQPRWLSFLNRQSDFLERLPNEFANVAIPNNKLAPNLAKQGIKMDQAPLVDVTLSLFNQEHPMVGGNSPAKVALRRAIALAYNSDEEIRLVRRNQAVRAQGAIAPLAFGYDPQFKTEMGDFDVARAKALLDLYGYLDRDGDGWREQPDGSALLLEYATQPDQLSRQLAELWQKSMNAIGVRITFKSAKWPENLKASHSGKLMMWGVGWLAGNPDGDTFLALGYGPNKGQANHSRFDLPAFNELYIRQNKMPDGPERLAVMQQASKLMVAYVPYKISSHRIATDLMHPWVQGYKRNPFIREFWKYLDVDLDVLHRELK